MAYKTAPDPNETGWPKGLKYIIGNEGCERFSFYGMKAILQVYLAMLFVMKGLEEANAESEANATVHFFIMGVYAFPLVGAIVADRLLGKYRTILWLSLVYCAGHAVLALADLYADPGSKVQIFYVGLALIAVGSGGIKPCVSAHVGDQFGKGNWHRLQRVFQIFYFIINFGSFFATLLIPLIRDWYGYSVAFAVPGILMFIATILFWMGRHVFVHVPEHPGGKLGAMDAVSSTLLLLPFVYLVLPTEQPLWQKLAFAGGAIAVGAITFFVRQRMDQDDGFLAVMVYTIRTRLGGAEEQPLPQAADDVAPDDEDIEDLRQHSFWGPAARRFGQEAAEGPIAVLKIISIFFLVSVFWALFDQHATSWVSQAKQMDLTLPFPIFGREVAAPEQVQALNPILVMLLIPFTAGFLYPLLGKLGFEMTPLRRMSTGMLMTGLAFVLAALIQTRLDDGADLSFMWQLGPYVVITLAEVMVSITGLEFAYSQAPKRMKSTIMSFWLLTVAAGNAMAGLLFHNLEDWALVDFFWLFAGLMGAAALLFSLRAAFYKYREFAQH
jgi:POT family proton-dependent oligopeptide transporter